MGHNWGSDHDQTAQCAPGGSSGNYIMYAQAVDGSKVGSAYTTRVRRQRKMVPVVLSWLVALLVCSSCLPCSHFFPCKPNNRRFSPCSTASMSTVLQARSSQCFDNSVAKCGNGLVEEGEICDCGNECARDPCCTTNCTIPAGKECSPQNALRFPCCTAQCTFVPESAAQLCAQATDCTFSSHCNGTSATCPPAGKGLAWTQHSLPGWSWFYFFCKHLFNRSSSLFLPHCRAGGGWRAVCLPE